jgi:hypothetical protein
MNVDVNMSIFRENRLIRVQEAIQILREFFLDRLFVLLVVLFNINICNLISN